MKPPKLGLIILILGLTALGTYLLSLIPKNQINQSSISYPSVKLSSPTPSALSLESFGNFDEKKNLTKNFGDALYKQIQQTKNLSNDDIDSLSEDLVNKTIGKSLAEFQLVSVINDSEIKISPDVSQEAKNQYLKTLGEINVKNFGDFKKNYIQVIVDTYQKLDYSSANRLANIYKNLANDYLNLTVPADWVGIHKQLILHVKNAEIIYRAMANYPTDPFKGLLAFESVDSVVNSAQEIQAILEEKIKEVAFK